MTVYRPPSVHFYTFDGGKWIERQRVNIPSFADEVRLIPTGVAISGNLAIIAPTRSSRRSGTAYVYRFEGATWREEREIRPSIPGRLDQFGYSVALSEDHALIAAPDDREWQSVPWLQSINGAVYAYSLGPMHKGDADIDGVLTTVDHRSLGSCIAASVDTMAGNEPFGCLAIFDFDGDEDVDLADVATFQGSFGCPE